MRLLTHNVLRNTAKDVIQGFPLKIEATKVEVRETEFDGEFVKNLLSTVSLEGLRGAASDLGLDVSAIPTEITPELREDESFLKALHGMLMDVHVVEGFLICPESKRRFPIQDGIPNLMLTDEEL